MFLRQSDARTLSGYTMARNGKAIRLEHRQDQLSNRQIKGTKKKSFRGIRIKQKGDEKKFNLPQQ